MDTAALKGSWANVAAFGDDVPLYFYSHLFLSHPEVRSMFPIQMSGQRDKLVAALGAVVSSVDELDKVVPLLEQLGRDHRRFAVITEHYAAVGASLLATLKKFLGPLWTPDLADTWAQAYGLVAKVMVAAAEQHEDIAPAYWEADVVSVERRSVEVAVIKVAPRQEFPYRAGQSVAVEIPQRPRLWRYFSPANAPQPSRRVQFHIQPIAGGLVSTAAVRRLSRGDTVKLAAPVGEQLTLPTNGPVPDLLMVAGGTGLAPLRAVLDRSAAAGRPRAPGRGCSCSTAHERLGTSTMITTSPGWPASRGLPIRRWCRRIPPTPAPAGLSAPWLSRPAIGLTGQPWSAARREWSGTRCRNSGLSAFLPRRSAASSSTFFEAPS
jgi:hemoglobin-like flavoprotein